MRRPYGPASCALPAPGLVKWLLRLDFLRKPRKLRDLDSEGGSDSSYGAPGRVAPCLDVAEPSGVEISTVSNLLLTEAESGSGLTDCLPEGDLGL
jgi:hypothetical protein